MLFIASPYHRSHAFCSDIEQYSSILLTSFELISKGIWIVNIKAMWFWSLETESFSSTYHPHAVFPMNLSPIHHINTSLLIFFVNGYINSWYEGTIESFNSISQPSFRKKLYVSLRFPLQYSDFKLIARGKTYLCFNSSLRNHRTFIDDQRITLLEFTHIFALVAQWIGTHIHFFLFH